MSHLAGVSITKLRFDKSPNIIMGGERNRPTQPETTVESRKASQNPPLIRRYKVYFTKANS